MPRQAFQDAFNFNLVDDGRYRAPVRWNAFPTIEVDRGETLTFKYSDYASHAESYLVDGVEGDGTLVFTPTEADGTRRSFVLSGLNYSNGESATAILHIDIDPPDRVPMAFDFTGEMAFVVYRGESALVQTVEWVQGYPEIEDFAIDNIDLTFYTNIAATTEIVSTDDMYRIGDQTLAEIVTLENFIDTGDTGSVDIRVDPSGITASELTMLRRIYMRLSVTQPSE